MRLHLGNHSSASYHQSTLQIQHIIMLINLLLCHHQDHKSLWMRYIDAIKASLKQASFPQASEVENGDVYVAMGPKSYCTPNVNNKKDIVSKQTENASEDVMSGSAVVPLCS